jgi:hypothetical protein
LICALLVAVLPRTTVALPHPANGGLEPAPPRLIEAALLSLEGKAGPDLGTGPPPHHCATSDLLSLDRAWQLLDTDQRARARRAIAPPNLSSAGGAGDSSERGSLGCFWNLINIVESDHFRAQWGSDGQVDPSDVDALLEHLEAARLVFLDAGYAPSLGSPNYKIPIYLGNSGPGAPSIDFSGGYATVCNSFEQAYVVLSSFGPSSTANVANHELFHTVQFGSPSPYDVDAYYWEASAVWAQKLAEPEFTGYTWPLSAYTRHTEWALTLYGFIQSTDGFLHKYAMFILPMYIAEFAPGGPEALLAVWNGTGPGLAYRLDDFWDDEHSYTDFPEQFGHFTAHVAMMDFEHHSFYTPHSVSPRDVLRPGADPHRDVSPDTYGSHFYLVGLEEAEGKMTTLQITFDGAPGWIVALSRSDDGVTAQSTVGIADGEGQVILEGPGLGSVFTEAWVIVTNGGEVLPSPGTYSLSLELVERDPTSGPGGEGCNTCGGSANTGHPFTYNPGLGLSLLLFPVMARRERRRGELL